MWSATSGFFILRIGNVFSLQGGKSREGVERFVWAKQTSQQPKPSPGWWNCLCFEEFPWLQSCPTWSRVSPRALGQSRGRGGWVTQQGRGGCACWDRWQCWLCKGCVGRLQQGCQVHGTWASLTVSSLGWISPKRKIMVSSVWTQTFLIYLCVAKRGI